MSELLPITKEMFKFAVYILGVTVCLNVVNSLVLGIIASFRDHVREQELATHKLEIDKKIYETMAIEVLNSETTKKK